LPNLLGALKKAEKNMKKMWKLLLASLVVMSLVVGCSGTNGEAEKSTEPTVAEKIGGSIILSTTTSTENSGLLAYILPDFTEQTGIEVKTVAVGTGKALQMGRDGDADVLLVHAKASEEEFIADGHGVERFDVMYNDFVILGPSEDPADLNSTKSSVVDSFVKLNDTKAKFVSRGDDSGTHKKEKSLWKSADITPEGDQYISAGKGMGDVIQMANELQAYTMSDRATYLSMSDTLELEVVVEGDKILFNQYGVMAVNPDKNDKINNEGANAFIEWLLSDETQELISGFGVEKFGQPLFIPNAK
jgi:tungstate transport system substrate-binding protein